MNRADNLGQLNNFEIEAMDRKFWIGLRIVGAAFVLWYTAQACALLGSNRATAAMMLLLEVLGFAALGDSILALSSSAVASLAFSFSFIGPAASSRPSSLENMVTFTAMAITALTASQLSIRAQRRAHEAIHKREEIERLNQLGSVLISANTMADAAESAVRNMVELFGLKGALLRVEEIARVFRWGNTSADPVARIQLDGASRAGFLELHGPDLSEEVGIALASMIRLALERARNSEERSELEAIRRGDELRSTVLNALAHNLKTPLTSIKAAASMLRGSEDMLVSDGQELIAVIDEEADRLNQLIRESLELAKLEGGRGEPGTEACRLLDIVTRVIARMERFLGERHIILDIPGDLPSIRGSRFLLEQMVLQVVDNAWKYSRPGTPIQISGAVVGGNVVLTIRNQGSQIPESERDRIFDKFYRGRKDRFTIEGTGLGLVIARKIAEAYEGKVWLDVEPEGPAFHFALPLEATERLHDNESHDIAR
jgi:two-component system, OmpR family, sensor histidine kinase KdpD